MTDNIKKIKGKVVTHLLLPLFLGVASAVTGALISVGDMRMGIAILAASVVYTIIVFIMYKINKPILLSELINFAMDYAQVQKELLKELAVPYGLLDKDGNVLWENDKIKEIAENENKIKSIMHEINMEELKNFENDVSKEQDIVYRNRNYHVEFKRVDVENIFGRSNAFDIRPSDSYLIAMYMFDDTEAKRIRKENFEQKMVAGLLYIDNYEEALQSVDTIKKSILTALIDRSINKYLANIDAVVRKLEKDKYFIIFRQKYLDTLQTDKFSIIDEVKTVNIGNEMAMTISIGLGVNGGGYNANFDYARAAMDLALGRGGDQAVIKDGDKVYYYGGKTKQVEKNTRVKARIKAHALREVLEDKDKVIIMGHKIGDVDSFGASIGVYRMVAAMNKKAHIVINDVTSSVRPILEKFTDNADYPEDLFIKSSRAVEMIGRSSALVVVDVSRPCYTECPELLGMSGATVILDHHRQSSDIIENPVLSYIEPYASSTCEMVAEILQYIQDGIKIRRIEADAMYGGIMIDTNNFAQKTGVRTFEAAAFLRRNGADVTRVKKMFRNDINDYRARAKVVGNAEVFLDSFAISTCPSEGLESPTVVGAQAANELLNINGIRASFVLTKHGDRIYVSARSMDEINVQLVMERLGGGGHMNMAGAQLDDCTIEEAAERVKKLVREMVKEGMI